MSASSSADVGVTAANRLRIDSRRRSFPDLRALLRARHLLFHLGHRDITVRYRQTVLGSVWIIVSPLLSAGLFSFVFGRVANLDSEGVPYFAFSYAGLLGWNLFSDTLSGASKSLVSNAALITKIHFPRLVLPLSTVASALLSTLVSFVIMLVLLAVMHVGYSVNLVLLPVWLLLSILLGMGIGLVLTSISVAYRDINYLTPALIPLVLYLTPVAYSSEAVPANIRPLYRLNPVATVIEGCRWSVLGHANLSWGAIAYTLFMTVALLIAGLVLFARREWGFADLI